MEKDEVLDHILRNKKRKTWDVDIETSTEKQHTKSLFPSVETLSLKEINSAVSSISLEDFWNGKPLPMLKPPRVPSIHATAFTETEKAFWDKNFPMAQIMQGIYRGSGKM
mgnify:FL=1